MNWPKLSEEELQMLEDLAAVFFTERQCAIVLEQEEKAFISAASNPISPIYKSFVEKLLQDYEFQKTVDQT